MLRRRGSELGGVGHRDERYEFAPAADGGTDVTESFRLVGKILPAIWYPLGGFLRQRRNQRDMLRTLERVKAVAEAAPPEA